MFNNKLLLITLFIFQTITTYASNQTNIQPGAVLKNTNVHESYNRRSNILFEIEKDTNVFIRERHKSWYKIDSEKKGSGWLRMLSVRYVGDAKQGFLGEVTDFSSDVFNVQRAGPTVTTGVRGIDEESFVSAKADYKTLKNILSKKYDLKKVKRFAEKGNLSAKNIQIPDSKNN